jgi:hypothetical protein
MAKSLKDIIKDRAGRNVPKGEEDFLALHSVKDNEDVNKNKNVFTAGNIKAEQDVQKNDPGKRHGYRSIKAAEKAYEQTSVEEATCNMTESGTMCQVHGLKECMAEDTYAHKNEMGETSHTRMKKKFAGFKQAMKEDSEDAEGEMAKTQLRALASKASDLVNMMQDNQDLESWVQSKITAAKHDIDAIHDYLIHREKPVEGVDTAMQFPHVNVDNAGFNV